MTTVIRTSLLALALLCALIAGCGSDDDTAKSSAEPAGNRVDRGFVAHMTPHHESAVQMAAIAERRAESAFVKRLAEDIARSQTEEIETMRSADRRLSDAGVQRGSLGVPDHMMGMDGDVASLTRARPFDAAFLRLMLPHHEGALVMAEAELKQGADPVLRELARSIISDQRREIGQMRAHLDADAQPGDGDAMDDSGHSG